MTRPPATAALRGKPLTDRDIEILRLILQGKSNPQIAKQMYLSLDTIKSLLVRIFYKLGVGDRTQAAVTAVSLGIVSSDGLVPRDTVTTYLKKLDDILDPDRDLTDEKRVYLIRELEFPAA